MGQSTSRQRFKQPKDLRDEPRVPARAAKRTWNERFADLTPQQQEAHLHSHRQRGRERAATTELAEQLDAQAKGMRQELDELAELLDAQAKGMRQELDAAIGGIEQRLYERLEARMVELVKRLAAPIAPAEDTKTEKSSEKKKG